MVAVGGGRPAVTVYRPGGWCGGRSRALVEPAIEGVLDSAAGRVRMRWAASGFACVDRRGRGVSPANASLSSARSTATWCGRPRPRRPEGGQATPPSPTTATADPALTPDVLTTAPTPVNTAQPNKAASTRGSSGSTLTSERRETVA